MFLFLSNLAVVEIVAVLSSSNLESNIKTETIPLYNEA